MSKPFGMVLTGKLIGEETKETKTKKGDIYRQRTVSIQTGKLQNVLVDLPADYRIEVDKNGVVSLPIEATAKQWDDNAKRFNFVQVKFYVNKDEVLASRENANPTS